MTKKIADLKPGTRFIYGRKNCMVLDHLERGTLCMVLDSVKCKFGQNNNYAESELKEYLNEWYLDDWLNDGACFTDFVEMEVDLTANDGLDDYGKCRCFLAPRTCEQHRKYRKLIPNPDELEWTVTAYSTESNKCSYDAYLVTSAGALSIIYFSYGVYSAYGVRPLFILNPSVPFNTPVVEHTLKPGQILSVNDIQYIVDKNGILHRVRENEHE